MMLHFYNSHIQRGLEYAQALAEATQLLGIGTAAGDAVLNRTY
jgi:hypothetical protein